MTTQKKQIETIKTTHPSSQSNETFKDANIKRTRRLRKNRAMRSLVSENQLLLSDLIYPIFIEENLDERTPINSLPGIFRETEKSFIKQINKATSLGINTFMLFGVSHNKDSIGSDTLKSSGLLYRMIDNAKNNFPDSLIMADLCFCEYTDHGHCGPFGRTGSTSTPETCGPA